MRTIIAPESVKLKRFSVGTMIIKAFVTPPKRKLSETNFVPEI